MKSIKRLKQIFAMALAMIMMLAMSVPAMADEAETAAATTYSITIRNASGTYDAYQVFQGDLDINPDTKETVLSNISWGHGVNSFSYKIGEGENESTDNAKKIAEFLTNNKASVKDFAEKASDHVTDPTATATVGKNESTVTISGLPAGYYVILNSGVGATESASSIILQVTTNQEIANKAEVPSFEKKLKDTNDTTGESSGWQDSADYDIGDSIPFMLKGTVAANYADYRGAYKFVFHDKEEAGLTFDKDSVKAYVDNEENPIDSKHYTVNTEPGDGCTFEIEFANLKDIASVRGGSKIIVEYTSVLNKDAVLGKTGNVNTAKLQFSNNPNSTQENVPTGETPWDNVIVFTYKIVVNKYANAVAEGNKLAGAEFTLQKILKDGSKKTIAVVKSADGTEFTFKGLDDGEYILTETKTPDKFNTIDPITFTVTAEHTIEWEAQERTEILTSLQGRDENTTEGKIAFSATEDKSELSTNIINKSGTTLPSTGGIGTRIFYVVGGVLMAGAAILLIVKKRMSKEN